MPAGQVIGRVSIRVLPDTDNFRRDAQRDLDRIEKQLKIEVPTKIDMSGASRELLEGIRTINARNRQLDSRKIRIHTRISTTNLREDIANAIRQYNKAAGDQNIRLRGRLAVNALQVELDQDSLKRVEDELKRWKDKKSPVKLPVELNWSTAKAAEVDAHIALLTRPRTVSIIPVLNNTAAAKVAASLAALSGARVLNDVLDGLWSRLKRLDQSVPIIGSIAEAVVGLSGYFITAASNLFALSYSLAQIGPAALLLPGILGGVAIGVGTMVAAFKDFNTIFPDVQGKLSALQDLISSNFWGEAEAPFRRMIDDIFPRLQAGLGQVSTQLGGFFGNLADSLTNILGPELDEMFVGLSQSIDIFAEHTDSLVGIITTLGNVGASRLPQLAAYVGDLADRFDGFLNAAEADGRLNQWIETAIQNMKDLGSFTRDFFGTFAAIGRAAIAGGGSPLAMLADTMERIRTVVETPAFQGGLTNVFAAAHRAMSLVASTSGPAVKDLLVSVFELLSQILPTVGKTIGVLFRGIAEALNQAAVLDGVRAMFDGLYRAVVLLEPVFGPLALAIGAVARIIGTLAPIIAQVVSAALIPLSNIFVQITPYIQEVANLLGEALLQVIAALQPALEQIVPLLAVAFRDAIRQLMPIIPVLAQGINDILIAIIPLIPQILALIPPFIQLAVAVLPPLIEAIVRIVQVIVPLISAILSLVNLIMPVLVPALTFLAKVLIDTVMFAVESVALVIEGAVKVFKGLIDFITGVFTGNWKGAWNGIKQILEGVFKLIVGAIGVFLSIGVLGAFSKGLLALRGLWKAGLDAVKALASAAWSELLAAFRSFLKNFGSAPSSALNAMKSLFSSAWSTIKSTASLAFDALKSTVKSKIGDLLGYIKGLPGDIKSALGDLSGLLKDAGIKLITGFIGGIKGKFDDVKGTLGSLTSKLTDWKGPESLDRVLLVGAGQLIIDGLITGLESRYDAVRKSLSGLTTDIASTQIAAPDVSGLNASGALATAVTGSLNVDGGGAGTTKVLNYYAAENNSLSSEEDLFTAANRARMVGW